MTLSPCPACGAEPIDFWHTQEVYPLSDGRIRHYVICDECGADIGCWHDEPAQEAKSVA